MPRTFFGMRAPLLLTLVLGCLVTGLSAQDTTVVARPARRVPAAVADSAQGRPKPLNYFFRSLLIPGWGQASLDRKLVGGIFVAFEGIALGMALKSNYELRYLERTNSERLAGKRAERQDWLFLIGVNHLFSALEAFVAANLYDFPGDLRARRMPDGRTGVGVTLPIP
ncbi:MAG: hypothetical protein ABJC19_05065 [Gemmatimonadota bacterium]